MGNVWDIKARYQAAMNNEIRGDLGVFLGGNEPGYSNIIDIYQFLLRVMRQISEICLLRIMNKVQRLHMFEVYTEAGIKLQERQTQQPIL